MRAYLGFSAGIITGWVVGMIYGWSTGRDYGVYQTNLQHCESRGGEYLGGKCVRKGSELR